MTTEFTFDESTHVYKDANGIARPSVSQVIKAEGLISFAGISPSVLERKRILGSLVHKATELYDQGENLDDYEIPEEVWPYFEGWLNFRNDTGYVPQLSEHQILAQVHGMQYGMKLDSEGLVHGEHTIIEKKCGASEHPAWGVQTAGYSLGRYPTEKVKPARAAVQLGPQFSRNYKTHPYREESDYVVWMNSLANTIWKINKKLHVFENEPERMVA